jgi:hypothetical protein
MATATKAAPKAADPKTTCSHRNSEGVRDCKQPRDPNRKRPSFCVKHELEAAQMRKARTTTKRAAQPARAKVAAKSKSAPKNGGGNLRLVKPPAPSRVAHPRVQKPEAIAAFVAIEEPKS